MIPRNRTQFAFSTFPFLLSILVACSSDSESPQGPLRILVTNDDGVGAPGIDVVVQALVADANNMVVVSAPAEQASGSGDAQVGDGSSVACAQKTGEATESRTASGHNTDVWAVDGCPADAVLYALENLYRDELPHVVLSGINEGQNVGVLSAISGTVGAAKTAACSGVPALASSQGRPHTDEEYDYEAGLAEVLGWLEDNRSSLLGGGLSLENITSINIPSCQEAASIRGTVEVALRTDPTPPDFVDGAMPFAPQDCESTFEDPQDDVEAFFSGFVAITPVRSNSTGTCDNLN